MFLYEQHCDATIAPTLIAYEEIVNFLKQIPLWKHDKDSKNIYREFKFKDYHHTLLFVNAVANIVHNENHHPEINFTYNQCSIQFSTHSANGITLFDLICAARVDQLLCKQDFEA